MKTANYFNHYIKIRTNHHLYEFENCTQFSKQVLERISENSGFKILEDEVFSVMTESNGCITFTFFTKFDKQTTEENVSKIVNQLFEDNFNVELLNGEEVELKSNFLDKDYNTFISHISTKLEFLNSENESMVNSLADFPEDTKFVEIVGLFGESSSDDTRLLVSFYNENNEPLNYQSDIPSWIDAFKNKFYETFSPQDQTFIEYKYIAKLLLGEVKEFFDIEGNKISFKSEKQNKFISSGTFEDTEISTFFDFELNSKKEVFSKYY